MPKCLECGYEMSELDKQCPKCARATPKDERVVVVCPHCGQKNRLPAGRSAAMRPAVHYGRVQFHNPFSIREAPNPHAVNGAVSLNYPYALLHGVEYLAS